MIMRIDSFMFTAKGGRDENQDSVGIKEAGASGRYIVADGLGGHQLGDLASRCAVDTLLGLWDENVLPGKEEFQAEVGKANEAILAVQKEKNCTTKSTVVMLCIRGCEAVWGNSGDSRLYFIRRGEILAHTDDHSVAYAKYRAGEITREEIPQDPDQSRLLRSLGSEQRWEPVVKGASDLQPGDAFLLCSDGFWEYVKDDEMRVDSLKARNAKEWAKLMLLRAAERIQPGCDNLSVITVMLQED